MITKNNFAGMMYIFAEITHSTQSRYQRTLFKNKCTFRSDLALKKYVKFQEFANEQFGLFIVEMVFIGKLMLGVMFIIQPDSDF